MSCSDTHCFPHSRNDRRDTNAEVVADAKSPTSCVSTNDCSWNEACSRGRCTLKVVCPHPPKHLTLTSVSQVGRCWQNRDCSNGQQCINTFCYPSDLLRRGDEGADTSPDAIPTPAPVSVDDSDDAEVDEIEAETADNMDVTPLEQDTLLTLVKAAQRGNKCRRRCRYHTDCCPKDACWNQTVCLGPHK